jgi:hypothetical protein
MRVVGIACVRDENDIIEPFVRHNLAWMAHLVVLDNGSSDGTREILQTLKDEGLSLDILDDPALGKYLSRRMTMLMREHAVGRCGADWVMPLDADEFVAPAGDGPLVPEWAGPESPVRLTWLSYVPDAEDDPAEVNPVVRIRHRLQDEPRDRIVKVFVPGQLAGRVGAVLEPGNHELSLDGRPCASVTQDRVCLAHFPIRSRGQFVAKTVLGHLQNLAVPFHHPRMGKHHRNCFELLQRDAGAFSGDFAAWLRRHGLYQFAPAAGTTTEPLAYRGGPLRYTRRADDGVRAWQVILDYADELARRYGLLKASLTEDQQVSVEHQLAIFAHFRTQLQRSDEHLHQERARCNQLQAQIAHFQELLGAADSRAAHFQELLRAADSRAAESRAVECRLRRSWTWRTGRLALLPARLLRRGWAACRRATAVLRRHRPAHAGQARGAGALPDGDTPSPRIAA